MFYAAIDIFIVIEYMDGICKGLPNIFSAEHTPRQHELSEEREIKMKRERTNFRTNSRKEFVEVCSIGGKITENSTADYTVRIATEEIISVWRKINSFYEINRKIISEMTPNIPIAHPR